MQVWDGEDLPAHATKNLSHLELEQISRAIREVDAGRRVQSVEAVLRQLGKR